MLDYKLLEALALVVQENGFERAARKLYITQSAVSQRIRALEDQSGQVLLARTTPPRATSAGRGMIKHYLQVRRLEDDLAATFQGADQREFTTLAIGINHDSLETWFFPAVKGFIQTHSLVLDLRSDDQEQTHRLLKDGEVIGCIGGMQQAMQGCRATYLGYMTYHMVATPGFKQRWFDRGLNQRVIEKAPLVIFNRSDRLHYRFFQQYLDIVPKRVIAHYLPSTERFVDFIASGVGYGFLLDGQCRALLSDGRLVELLPDRTIKVPLYWHCWNLNSPLLVQFSDHLVNRARQLLAQ